MPVEQDSNGNSTSSSKENRKILIFCIICLVHIVFMCYIYPTQLW